MSKEINMRLSQIARKLNVGTETITDFLIKKGIQIENKPNAKITPEQFEILTQEFTTAAIVDKKEAASLTIGRSYTNLSASKEETTLPKKGKEYTSSSSEDLREKTEDNAFKASIPTLPSIKKLGKITLPKLKIKKEESESKISSDASLRNKITQNQDTVSSDYTLIDQQQPIAEIATPKSETKISFTPSDELQRPKVLGRLTLPISKHKKLRPTISSETKKRITTKVRQERPTRQPDSKHVKQYLFKKSIEKFKTEERGYISPQEVQDQIKKTLAKISQVQGDMIRSKYKREKRIANLETQEREKLEAQKTIKVLKVTEFISAHDLASLMGVTVNEVLSVCISLGMIVSINQRLDAESITIIADEFGYDVDFVNSKEESNEETVIDNPNDLIERSPIITIMGHVDHGKTSLLDYIRKTKVAFHEAGGITQHIGAYEITTFNNKKIVFLDTPGHEAFTAMRTRGAKITDIIIIVIAADDGIMPQTKEAISHAQIAGCPIIIAITKIDKAEANPEKVKEGLAQNNILVEDWGGKYQCQAISSKTGEGIEELLEKILLEADLMDLKANPQKAAQGTVLEAFLDPGRGYVTTTIVQNGTLRLGDIIFAGMHYGKTKTIMDKCGNLLLEAPPSTPVQIVGLNGAPQSGDILRVVNTIKEATEITAQKKQIFREQSLRTKTHITLHEIGRRLAVGNFQQLNLIIKGDVDGSVEVLSDSLLKISNEEVKINIMHKGVGAVSESDVLLAAVANAIIIAFHLKPTTNARKLAEREGVEMRLYAIIYDAINDIKETVQNMLAPTIKEIITGKALIKKIFQISKVGTIAGCQVIEGYIKNANPIRVIRKDQIIYTGTINKMKHLLEEIKQAKAGSECGIDIKNFDNIEVDDIIEGFEQKKIKRILT